MVGFKKDSELIKDLQDEVDSLKEQLASERARSEHEHRALSHMHQNLHEARRERLIYLDARKERDFWTETIGKFITVAPPEKALELSNQALARYRELAEEAKAKIKDE